MKKILSLVLAAAMLSTTAMAARVDITPGVSDVANPGDTLTITSANFEETNSAYAGFTLSGIGYRFSTEYFTVATKKFAKGANLVKEVKLNDDKNTIDIVLNDNYELTRPVSGIGAGPNLVIDELTVKAKKAYDRDDNKNTAYQSGDIKKGSTYKFDDTTAEYKIGYSQDDLVYEQELDSSPSYQDGRLVKFVAKNGVNYETVSLDGVDLVYIEGRVYDGNKVYIGVDYDVNKEVLQSNEAATMYFVNIKTSGLPTTNVLQLTAEEDEFVYKIVDGKLVDSGLKWSADDSAWVGKIRSTSSYVISDIKLTTSAAAGSAPTGNPETGANDVVGIAAALAVVSLVAAGAVSLKK